MQVKKWNHFLNFSLIKFLNLLLWLLNMNRLYKSKAYKSIPIVDYTRAIFKIDVICRRISIFLITQSCSTQNRIKELLNFVLWPLVSVQWRQGTACRFWIWIGCIQNNCRITKKNLATIHITYKCHYKPQFVHFYSLFTDRFVIQGQVFTRTLS